MVLMKGSRPHQKWDKNPANEIVQEGPPSTVTLTWHAARWRGNAPTRRFFLHLLFVCSLNRKWQIFTVRVFFYYHYFLYLLENGIYAERRNRFHVTVSKRVTTVLWNVTRENRRKEKADRRHSGVRVFIPLFLSASKFCLHNACTPEQVIIVTCALSCSTLRRTRAEGIQSLSITKTGRTGRVSIAPSHLWQGAMDRSQMDPI